MLSTLLSDIVVSSGIEVNFKVRELVVAVPITTPAEPHCMIRTTTTINFKFRY